MVKSVNEPNAHGTELTRLIEEILHENSLEYQHLSAVACSIGPGSFTGLRIGLSVAKGICYGADLPLIEVPTLQHLSYMHPQNENVFYFPMIDARRMEVYGALLDKNHSFITPPFPCLIEEYDWDTLLADKTVIFTGNGVDKSTPILQKYPSALLYSTPVSAATMAIPAFSRWAKNEWADLAYAEPFYLKDVRITTSAKNQR